MDKQDPKKNPSEKRSVFHDDKNLQDEQDKFEAANPPERRAAAVKRLFEYWEKREKEKQPPADDKK